MRDPRHPIPEMDAFREQLRAAAAREQEAAPTPAAAPDQEPPRPPRRRRFGGGRGLAIGIAALVLGGGTVAVATSVISVGEPEQVPNGFRPGEADLPADGTRYDIVVRAPDRAQRLQWGVGAAPGDDGDTCLVAGQVRGDRIGLISGDEFRPYPADNPSYCTERAPDGLVRTGELDVRTKTPRRLYYGTAGRDVARVVVEIEGERVSATPGRGGVFLIVLEAGARMTAGPFTYDAAGRRLNR